MRGMRSLRSHQHVLDHRPHPGYQQGCGLEWASSDGGAEPWNGPTVQEPNSGAVVDPEIRLDGVFFLKLHLKKEETPSNMGRSDLPRLRIVSVVLWVFQFCFVFGTKNLNKYSPAAGAYPISAGLSL